MTLKTLTFDFLGHCARQRGWYSVQIPSLKFVGLPIPKDMADFWPWR